MAETARPVFGSGTPVPGVRETVTDLESEQSRSFRVPSLSNSNF